MSNHRIAARFATLKALHKKAFIPFITAGDPNSETFAHILAGLPQAGADLIEIGMPFSDPMADGPAIEAANLRAFASGMNLKKILSLVTDFRVNDLETPIILMGYVNPLLSYGIEAFVKDAATAGVDGLILADLPPEEDAEIRLPAHEAGIDLIRLAAPTTDAHRWPTLLQNAHGFLYFVAVTGITGSKQAEVEPVRHALTLFRQYSSMPVVVGFGIRTTEHARALAAEADGIVVGSAIVSQIAERLDGNGQPKANLARDVLAFVTALAAATHNA